MNDMQKHSALRARFTTLELGVLVALFKSSEGNGHDFGLVEDARGAVDFPAQLGGVITSLVRKGIITNPTEARTNKHDIWHQFYFSGVNEYQTHVPMFHGVKVRDMLRL